MPEFESNFKVVTMDRVGAGASVLKAYDRDKYASLHGYADDLVEIGRELDINGGILVGHSVNAMIGALTVAKAPEMCVRFVMVSPSPRYIDDAGYVGGFSETEIEELLQAFEENPLAWSASMAPAIMGNPDQPHLGQELRESFCRTDPDIARHFARVTFTSDNRGDLAGVGARTLILQCREDIIAPEAVDDYVYTRVPTAR